MNNFVSVFEELSKLYEADELEQDVAVEDEAVEVADEAPVVEGPKQLVLECSKCGAIIVKSEEGVVIDEATDLANVEDKCSVCEEAAGYKVLGELLPYGVAEEVEDDKAVNVEEDLAATGAEPEQDAAQGDEDPGEESGDGDGADEVLEEGIFDKKPEVTVAMAKSVARLIPVDQIEKGDIIVGNEDRDIYPNVKSFTVATKVEPRGDGRTLYHKNLDHKITDAGHKTLVPSAETKFYVIKKSDIK